ncbi:hypothetical protein Plhal304r1_c005g0018841 [Plasmopara halstedii]
MYAISGKTICHFCLSIMPRKPIHYIKKLWSRLSSFREDFVQCNKRYYAPPVSPLSSSRQSYG